jgi:hypothetical protein
VYLESTTRVLERNVRFYLLTIFFQMDLNSLLDLYMFTCESYIFNGKFKKNMHGNS